MVEDNGTARSGGLLDKLNAFRVILLLDFLIVYEARVLRNLPAKLETSVIKRVLVLRATDVLDINDVVVIHPVPRTFPSDTINVDIVIGTRTVRRGEGVIESAGCCVVVGRHHGGGATWCKVGDDRG
jgi:hypothetical protein